MRQLLFLILLAFLLPSILFAESPSQNFKNFESPKCNINETTSGPEKHLSPVKASDLSAIRTPENFPTFLKILTNTQVVILGPVGAAAACDKECTAFLSASKSGSSIRKELEWMLKNATPAGKLYAAILLKKFDSKAGEQALISLQSEKTPVSYTSGGCTGGTILPLGEHATQLLKNPNY